MFVAPLNLNYPAARASSEDARALEAYLVETIHSARVPLALSSVLGACTTTAAFAIVGAPIFLALTAAHLPIGLGRLHRLMIWDKLVQDGLTARDIVACERAFRFWSALFALMLGLTCYELSAHREAPDAFALSISLCAGFSIALATRSAGRPLTLATQIAGVVGPEVYALLTLDLPHGVLWAGLACGLALAALVIGRNARSRLVALHYANAESRRLAESDILTGLMNRYAMARAFARALDPAHDQRQRRRLVGDKAFARALDPARRREATRLVVYALDLDRFKQINDAHGHLAGDAVLVETAARLRAVAQLAESADIARMGGDEFVVVARVGDPEAFGQAMLARLSETFVHLGAPIALAASVGAAVHHDREGDAEQLMKQADRALYEAKRAGRGRFRSFDSELAARIAQEKEIERGLEDAFVRDELEVWFQPIHWLSNGEVSGYEALVRWRHPQHGMVAPDRFIAIAEQNGAIHRLGEIVLTKACCEAATWDHALTLAVNLSPVQFRRPEPLVASVRRALETSGLPPERLFLEITENFLIDDTPTTRLSIQEIAAMGVRFSLDDFGRGYSSLAYVQHYPFSKIKIDREFVRNIPTQQLSCAIVESVCLLARRTGMSVVAEGVETETQRVALADLGVELAQGYLFGRPEREPCGRRFAPAFAELRRSG